jgi:hypothetical protein
MRIRRLMPPPPPHLLLLLHSRHRRFQKPRRRCAKNNREGVKFVKKRVLELRIVFVRKRDDGVLRSVDDPRSLCLLASARLGGTSWTLTLKRR